MTRGYDRAAAARYWGGERLSRGDDLAAVLSLGEPREVNEAYDRWERTLIERALAPLAGRRVLDAGCGVGRVTRALAAGGARVIALDSAPGMLDRCRANLDGVPVTLLRSDADRAALRDASLDAAICVGVLEHLPADLRRDTLAELTRVVRPGGRIALVANNAASELLRRPGDNPHRRGTQLDNGYYCELVGEAEVMATLESLGWRGRVAGANPFYALLRFRRHATPPLDLDGAALRDACEVAVDLDLATSGAAEFDRRWADHFFIVAERA